MRQAAANTGIMPMALVAVEQYLPKSQRIVDDGLALRALPMGQGCLWASFDSVE
jgi:hypothetical protein